MTWSPISSVFLCKALLLSNLIQFASTARIGGTGGHIGNGRQNINPNVIDRKRDPRFVNSYDEWLQYTRQGLETSSAPKVEVNRIQGESYGHEEETQDTTGLWRYLPRVSSYAILMFWIIPPCVDKCNDRSGHQLQVYAKDTILGCMCDAGYGLSH